MRTQRLEYDRERSRKRRLERTQYRWIPCIDCGKERFVIPHGTRYTGRCQSCAQKARQALNPKVLKPVRYCTECTQPLAKRQRFFCSRTCGYQANLRQKREQWAEQRNTMCRVCNEREVEVWHRLCTQCLKAHAAANSRRTKIRRRTRLRTIISEKYTLDDIARRDDYRCGFCFKQVNMSLVSPHPRSPTIDHIVPISTGGDDIKANVRLAHHRCNSIAGARGEKQLMLVG